MGWVGCADMPWKWGDPGGVIVSEHPELLDKRFSPPFGVLIIFLLNKLSWVGLADVPGITNGTTLDAPDGVLTPCTGVPGSLRPASDAGRVPVVRLNRPPSNIFWLFHVSGHVSWQDWKTDDYYGAQVFLKNPICTSSFQWVYIPKGKTHLRYTCFFHRDIDQLIENKANLKDFPNLTPINIPYHLLLTSGQLWEFHIQVVCQLWKEKIGSLVTWIDR